MYGAVPPAATTSTVVVPPLHEMIPTFAVAFNNDNGCVIEIVSICVQPFASFTVTVCVPATTVVKTLLD